MSKNRKRLSLVEENPNGAAVNHPSIGLNPSRFIELLDEAAAAPRIAALRKKATAIKQTINAGDHRDELFNANGNGVSLRRDILTAELEQVLAARTIERARYYLQRLARGVADERTTAVNDINLRRWKEYDEVITDSLWVEPKRDTAGAHLGSYWGNFIPQIPRQLMLRYTKKHDWVLDCFLGSGTTLIECRRHQGGFPVPRVPDHRHSFGVDIFIRGHVIQRAGESLKNSIIPTGCGTGETAHPARK